MFDLRPILMVVGVLLATLGAAMMVPAIIDIAFGHPGWQNFAVSGVLTLLVGAGLWTASHRSVTTLTLRQAFVMTTLVWIALSAFGALPIYWSGMVPSYTDAFFESISGITTTGATVIEGLDKAPPGLLFWRAMLQWMGGLGIIVMAIAVFPMLQIGGMQLFKVEAFDTPEKILPRATQISGSMTMVFIVLTAICAISYAMAGMSAMDATMHAMTTVATGGFSSHDQSIAFFDSAYVDWVAIIFMCIGSLPFLLYVKLVQGAPSALFRDSQVRVFFMLLVFFTLIIWGFTARGEIFSGSTGLRYAAFNVVSIMTGTGYATADYGTWGAFSVAFFFTIMFIGGCAGSTSCGIKVFRFQVLFEDLRQHLSRIVYPNGIFVKRFNGMPLSDSVSAAVLSFLFIYMVCFAVLAMLLSLTGLDNVTAFSGAASAISNVGPGLGAIIGPVGHYGSLNDPAKWILAAGMLIGRLELFAVLVLFIPQFWRS